VRNSIVGMISPCGRARDARFGKPMFALAAAAPARINGPGAASQWGRPAEGKSISAGRADRGARRGLISFEPAAQREGGARRVPKKVKIARYNRHIVNSDVPATNFLRRSFRRKT
jgi:hypothetical protein